MMLSYQQRIPLKGTEDSIEYFIHLLKNTKNEIAVNSAEVLLKSMIFWHNGEGSNQIYSSPATLAHVRARSSNGGLSRVFYLQVLTTPDVMRQIGTELDIVRRSYVLKTLLDGLGVGRAEYLLEALILLIECFRLYGSNPQQQSTKPNLTRTNDSVIKSPTATMNAPTIENPRTYQKFEFPAKNSLLDCSRQNSVEPSVTYTQARIGSVGRDEGFEFPSKSWRTKLREQQIADNRKLIDSVRSRGNSAQREYSASMENNITNSVQGPVHDNSKYLPWMPLHEFAMRSRNDNDDVTDKNNNSVYLPTKSTSSKPVTIHNYSKRELSEPPIHHTSSRIFSPEINTSNKRRLVKQDAIENDQKRLVKSTLSQKYDLEHESKLAPVLKLKDRKKLAEALTCYLSIEPPQFLDTPGYEKPMTIHERVREGIDCDEVFPNIILGNGATVRRKDYLRKIGITHILNAAEWRGVNIGEEYFNQMGDHIQYLGIRIEDTPNTLISRHFMKAAEFMDTAIQNNGKVFVNCVFGKSRSTTFVVIYMMLCHNFDALSALKHIRQKRNVQINPGFLLQIVDLDHRLKWER